MKTGEKDFIVFVVLNNRRYCVGSNLIFNILDEAREDYVNLMLTMECIHVWFKKSTESLTALTVLTR